MAAKVAGGERKEGGVGRVKRGVVHRELCGIMAP
jgi:hypothetical protein